MRFGSLFAGIGGIDLGLERAGMTCVWQVEIDPVASKILQKHWPTVRRYSDVRTLQASALETVDLICGGFPCQPVSVAGKRQAQNDPRWLWPEFARVVDGVRPSIVLVENVPGLLTTAGSEVVADLAEMGYDAEWGCVSASAIGAPYRRLRFFLIATDPDSDLIRTKQINERWFECSAIDRDDRKTNDANINRSRFSGREESHSQSKEPEVTPRRNDVVRRYVFTGAGWWTTEPDVGRVVPGFPGRVDRIRCLGNAVVPQVAEYLGCMILKNITTPLDPTEQSAHQSPDD